MITIINYGMGNLGSVQNMFKKIGVESKITSNILDIKNATKLLLPGVGAFDEAMKNLKNLGLIEIIKHKVMIDKTPILGICLGMQLLTKGSEEGSLLGFDFIDALAIKFDFSKTNDKLPIPHMGWNKVKISKDSPLFLNCTHENRRFYFVHTYAVDCQNEEDILAFTNYGKPFVSVFEKDNIIGCQFHPEKSHKFGMQILSNFAREY